VDPEFGTLGLRGLVNDLKPDLIADYTRAFLTACPLGTGLYVGPAPLVPHVGPGGDRHCARRRYRRYRLRQFAAPRVGARSHGGGCGGGEVKFSYIPPDHNGLTLDVPKGEIIKAAEPAILAAFGRPLDIGSAGLIPNTTAGAAWVARCVTAFGAATPIGRRIGVLSHSAVSRDLQKSYGSTWRGCSEDRTLRSFHPRKYNSIVGLGADLHCQMVIGTSARLTSLHRQEWRPVASC
jgi:phosphomannomutase